MKVSAVSPSYYAGITKHGYKVTNNPEPTETTKTGTSVISFKGGNKKQAIEWCVENKPYFQSGGVATAINDRRCLRVSENDPIITETRRKNIMTEPLDSKAFVMPLYNGSLIYDSKNGVLKSVEVPKIPEGLPDSSPFKKYEGKFCLINHPRFQNYVNVQEFFQKEGGKNPITGKDNLNLNQQVFILDEIPAGRKKMDFGGTEDTNIRLFRVMFDKNGSLVPTNDYQVFTDVTDSWKGPYQEGGYATSTGVLSQTWKGNGDARAAKAFVEELPVICEDMSKNGTKFDPASIICNDSQAAYSVEYMAQKAATGEEFWQGKSPKVIGHNMGDGYIGKTSYMNMFVNIADKELRTIVSKDPNYIEALKQGEDAVNKYFASLIPEVMKDKQGSVSPFMNAIYYALNGYVPTIGSVSEPYIKKLVSDPNFAPGTHEYLKKLYGSNNLVGIVNSLEGEDMNPYTKGIVGYYGNDTFHEYTFPDGYKVNGQENFKISMMKPYNSDLVNENNVDINHVREIKRQNKISLFERLNKDALEQLKALQSVEGHEYDLATVIAGQNHRKVEVYGYIDSKYLDEVRKPNSDVKLLTSWGRGDTQKGLDTVLEAFEKYILGPGKNDKNTVLVMGGDLSGSAEETSIKNIINRMNENPELKGRFVYLNGFAPNKPLASAADFAVFPSRFAPCELTDLEAMKVFCAPIVTNCQGLAQKNYDASFVGEAEKVTGYKTKHEFFTTSLDELRDALPENSEDKKVLTKTQLDKTVKAFKDKIKEAYRIRHAGAVLDDAALEKQICTDGGLHYKYNFEILRPFRDQVISDELAQCFERALITDRNKDIQTKMVQNHLKLHTDWERNGALSATGKSSAELYRDLFFEREGTGVKSGETLLDKLKANCNNVIERVKNEEAQKKQFEEFLQNGGNTLENEPPTTRSGKLGIIVGIAAAVAAGLAVGYALFHKNSDTANQDESAQEKREQVSVVA